ncbi:tetratricopeptide repeat protein [Roseofilum casamattae]|uniref:Tetratricopeptide repeat protein n=1 Tax=Roseofilum casamattae BLCC-M143 TaxID=3022442 RepID=A0ABT7BUQ6_9CYAN|nr:tetratricopeptide repeat protein [Roseofilum casamattae]MDJ1182923.1 tetratricopeptide repeat protein [Roseofilum casamattae BLCC-M143]
MLDRIAQAFADKDYRTAQRLLKNLLHQDPKNLWGQFYAGRLYEERGKPDLAESIYRRLLRQAEHPKLASQARSGLKRIQDRQQQAERKQRENALSRARQDPNQSQPGLLIIEPVVGEARKAAVQEFARIMKLDLYGAGRQLPGRFWRLQRTGAVGELAVYGRELQAAGIPAFWVDLQTIEKIRVFRVQSIQEIASAVSVLCRDESDRLGSFKFKWSEVAQQVRGRLPIFESVAVLDGKGKYDRVEQTQDYVYLCDLHLPHRNSLLRFCDRAFEFHNSPRLVPETTPLAQLSNRLQWNALMEFAGRELPDIPIWSEFTPFAEMVLQEAQIIANPRDLFGEIQPHIDVIRRAETDWDRAFALYTGSAYVRYGFKNMDNGQ